MENPQSPAEQLGELMPCMAVTARDARGCVTYIALCHNCRLRPALLKWYEDGVEAARDHAYARGLEDGNYR